MAALLHYSKFKLQHLGAIHVDALTSTLPVTATWCPSCPFSASGVLHHQNLLILVGNHTMLAPVSRISWCIPRRLH